MSETRKTNRIDSDQHRAPRGVVFGSRWMISGVMVLLGIFLFTYSVWGSAVRENSTPGPVVSPAVNLLEPKPLQISIPAINVAAPITALGLNSDRTLATPADGREVGWYMGSSAPGALGPSVLVGHLDTVFGPAIFYDLKNLKPGDLINIARDDGSTATFEVLDSQTYRQDDFPTDKVYGAIDYKGLRLITCAGTYNRIKGHYSDNLVVYASLVSIHKN